MQIVIPMSGRGTRFLAAGYRTIKPLIEIDDRPIIEHIVRQFPPGTPFLFICAEDHLAETPLRTTLERIAPAGKIVAIPATVRGPVAAIMAAADAIADEAPVLIHYCDFIADWNFAQFRTEMAAQRPAGCIHIYRGFHPHRLGPGKYATLRMKANLLAEIREKHAFTEDPMNEPTSTGAYYFDSGKRMKMVFRIALVRPDMKTGEEVYCSSPFNILVEHSRPVTAFEVPHFVQWGTPEDVAEYRAWSDFFRHGVAWQPPSNWGQTQLLFPLAGTGERFRLAGYTQPKPLVNVAGVPMLTHARNSYPAGLPGVAVLRADDAALASMSALLPGLQIITVPGLTAGQAATCRVGLQALKADQPVFVAPCDARLVYTADALQTLLADETVDAVIFTFRNHSHANRQPAQYGWVATDAAGRATRIACKEPLSDHPSADAGIVGAFWCRRAGELAEAIDRQLDSTERIHGEAYLDMTMAEMIRAGKNVRVFDVMHYVGLGVPDDVKTYEYWERYLRKARHHPYGKRKI